ncbi:MAG: extracellular solute-binding protein [Chloroflexota bacterium]
MRKVNYYLMTIVIMASFLLIISSAPSRAQSESHEPVTLKWINYSQERLDFYKQAITEFQKEYPWVSIDVETMVEDDYKQTLPLMFRSNNAPDIFVYTFPAAGDYFELPELLTNQWVQPLDSSVLPADFRQRFHGTSDMMEPIYSHDGQVYTIPRPPSNGAAGYAYLYYNKDVIEKAGLTDKIPSTWQEFHDACEQIKEKAGAYCFAEPMIDPREIDRLVIPFFSTSVKGFSDSLISSETGKYTTLTDPEFVKAIEYLRGLYEEGLPLPGQYDKVAARQAVANGQAAFYFDGGWMSSVFPTSFNFSNFGVALPLAPDGNAPSSYLGKIASGPPLAETFISSQSKHPHEATLFLEWMTRPDGWYIQNFTAQGFDILPWGDPKQLEEWMPQDNLTRDLIPLDPEVHVMAPQPSLKCPDLAKSQARTNVEAIQSDWGYVAIVDYLSNGGDWMQIAQNIEDQQNSVFEDTLKTEAASGLNVSTSCFAEPTWDGVTDFDYSVYNSQ